MKQYVAVPMEGQMEVLEVVGERSGRVALKPKASTAKIRQPSFPAAWPGRDWCIKMERDAALSSLHTRRHPAATGQQARMAE